MLFQTTTKTKTTKITTKLLFLPLPLPRFRNLSQQLLFKLQFYCHQRVNEKLLLFVKILTVAI